MLRQLKKEEIADKWNLISQSIEKALPPIASSKESRMRQVYNNLMLGTMQCWASYEQVGGKEVLNGIGTTTIIYDLNSGTKMLLGYSMYSIRGITDSSVIEGYPQLVEFAKEHGCECLCAYTEDRRVAELAAGLGAKASIFLTLPTMIQSVSKLESEV